MKNGKETIEAWHFLSADMRFRYGDQRKANISGKWQSAKGPLEVCRNGMHASLDLMDAMRHAPGPILCRVELRGPMDIDIGKLCARSRKILWHINAEKLLHEFALLCADRALRAANVSDERCWNAIKIKRDWLKGEATDVILTADMFAAWTAAKAASRDAAKAAAAGDAAMSAAWAASMSAAWAADMSASGAAGMSAAWAADMSAVGDTAGAEWQRKTLLSMIDKARREQE